MAGRKPKSIEELRRELKDIEDYINHEVNEYRLELEPYRKRKNNIQAQIARKIKKSGNICN